MPATVNSTGGAWGVRLAGGGGGGARPAQNPRWVVGDEAGGRDERVPALDEEPGEGVAQFVGGARGRGHGASQPTARGLAVTGENGVPAGEGRGPAAAAARPPGPRG